MRPFAEKLWFIICLTIGVQCSAVADILCVIEDPVGDCVSQDCDRCGFIISNALALALPGDTIRVSGGSYQENITINQNIVVEGGWATDFSSRDLQAFPTVITALDNTLSVVTIAGVFGNSPASTPLLDGFWLQGSNVAADHGAGLRMFDSNATISNNRIRFNDAFLLGGGIWVQRGAPIISDNLIENNSVGGQAGSIGGGVMLEGTDGAMLIHNEITNNVVLAEDGLGGGVGIQGGRVILIDNTIDSNEAVDQGVGGGVGATLDADVEIRGGAVTNNNAEVDCDGYGGGIGVSNAGSVRIQGVRVEANCSYFGGGGFYNFGTPDWEISNTIFASNDGGGNGNAVLIDTNDAGTLVHNSFVGDGTGTGVATPGDLTLVNNIVTAYATGVQVSPGTAVSVKGNVFFANLTDVQNLVPDPALNLFVNPLLDADEHLLAGSPAIDTAAFHRGPFIDIDGESRPADGGSGFYRADIGADEAPGEAQLVVNLEDGMADLTINGSGNPGGNQNTDWIGYAVLGADVTGDGLDDLLFTAQDWAQDFDNDVFANGHAFSLFHFGQRRTGTIDLVSDPVDLELISLLTNWHVGEALVSGDLNDDGTGDMAIGAGVQDDGDDTIIPTVMVYFGGPDLAGAMNISAQSPGNFALLGQGGNGAALGGWNGNGLAIGNLSEDDVADLIAGEVGADIGGVNNTGAVHVMFGGGTLGGVVDLSTTPADFTLVGPTEDAQLGSATVGELNADSQSDLAARTAGTAYVLFGPISTGMHALANMAADVTVSGLGASPFFDQLLIGDATGDASNDLVLASGDAFGHDRILVFAGPLQAGQTLEASQADQVLTLHEDISSFTFGNVLGDARPDLIVGSRDAEEVYVISPGSAASGETFIPDIASQRVVGNTHRQLGWDVSSGDLDGDTQADLIIGTWQLVDPAVSSEPNDIDTGRIFVLYGGATPDNCPGTSNGDQADTDTDGVGDACDNCAVLANSDQRDTDSDGFGNACDADLSNDCVVNFIDLGIMKSAFFTADSDADLDGDGSVNFVDLAFMKAGFFLPPGPSGFPNACNNAL